LFDAKKAVKDDWCRAHDAFLLFAEKGAKASAALKEKKTKAISTHAQRWDLIRNERLEYDMHKVTGAI
jgi:hypothetical protein